MNRQKILNMVAAVCVSMPTTFLKAEEAQPAVLRLSHGVLRYDMAKSETDDGSTTTEQESSGFTTFAPGVEIAAFWKGFAAYAYPVTAGGTFMLGRSFGGNQELGVVASINSYKVKDGDESTYNSIGGYYFYGRPLSANLTLEFDLIPALIMGGNKSTNGGTTEEQDGSGYSLYLDLIGVVPLAKNFEYVFGIDYTMTRIKTDVKGGGATVTEKDNASNLGLILAKFRYFI